MPLDIRRYLDRIGYSGPTRQGIGFLRRLHRAHMHSIPFENLEIHSGRPIVLDEALLYDKVVGRNRGGFCYELNGLFAAVLRQLGFHVTLLAAGVASEEGGFGPEFDHMTLLVRLPDPWLADVGFGDSFVEPIRLVEGREQRDAAGTFRLLRDGEQWVLQRRRGDEPWADQYRFRLVPRVLSEFREMCAWQQTSPESSFTRRRICSRATEDGRISVSDLRLILTRGGQREERPLRDETEWRETIRLHFGFDPL